MNLKLCATALAGLLFGMAGSDVATLQGFPHDKYLLELAHEPTARSDFVCMKRGSVLGENLSEFDSLAERQKNCFLVATGKVLKDGSFDGYLGSTTWYYRIKNAAHPIHIPAADIKSAKSGYSLL